MRKQRRRSASRLPKLISAFVFAKRIVQSLLKFQASSHLLKLYSLVYVGPGRKSERWFPHNAAQLAAIYSNIDEDICCMLQIFITSDSGEKSQPLILQRNSQNRLSIKTKHFSCQNLKGRINMLHVM